MAPPSLVVTLQRLNPEPICWSSDASGSKSPARFSIVNSSKGMFAFSDLITQSRYFHITRGVSRS